MLVLSRKPTERIRIAGGIMITIVHVNGDKVSIGVEAPPNVRVMRDELPDDFKSVSMARATPDPATVPALRPVPELELVGS